MLNKARKKAGNPPPSAAEKKSKALRGGWRQQVSYAFSSTLRDVLRQPLSTLFTLIVIAISLTLPSICYMVWKNVNHASTQWYPSPQLTVYFDKSLKDEAMNPLLQQLKQIDGIEHVNYLSRAEALGEFRHWSGFNDALDLLEENPLPAVAVITPKLAVQSEPLMEKLSQQIAKLNGVDEVKTEGSWFSRLAALTGLVAKVSALIGILMVIAVFLVIGNSVRLTIFSRRETIHVMKLLGATDGFILRPFLQSGALLGFAGGFISLFLLQFLVWRLTAAATQTATVFGTAFTVYGLSWEESLILLLVSTMIGWLAAWLATVLHLRHFSVS